MNWAELKYRIADWLFEAELDEAFNHGVKEGERRLSSILRVEMDYKKTRAAELGMTKTQTLGYDRCVEVVTNVIK